MASVLQRVETLCRNCGNPNSTIIDVFELIPLDELQQFVDDTFVAPCGKCSSRDWKMMGFYGYE